MPSIQHLPVPVLERIAAWVAVDHLRLGPPVHLVKLFLLNRYINYALSSPHTLARVFGLLFDLDAPRRRFGRAALTAQTLAVELKLRCLSLSRLRHTPQHEENFMDQFDLWTAYIMLLEDDGKNRRWLVEYVDIRPKVARMLETTLADLSDNYSSWPDEDAQAALGAWILALTDSQDPRHITDALEMSQATSVVRLLFIFVYNPYIYTSHFARLDLWDLPLPAGSPDTQLVLNELESDVHPLVPPERERQAPATSLPFHFGVRRPLAIPSMAHAAIACYLARTPWGAPQALAPGEVPSDYWRSQSADWQTGYTRFFGSAEGSGSKKRDTEWRRLTLSGDLYNGPVPGLDTVVEPGDIEGRWGGYYRMPELGQFSAMLTSHPSPPPANLTPTFSGGMAMMFNQSVQWRVREYHCLRSEGQTPLSADRAWALDAWFPPGWENYVRLPNGSLRFWDERRGAYTTYVRHHACIAREDILDTIILGKPDDDWVGRHEAFHVYGRVRRADGLIMLRADSVDASGHGRWLWYGYIHCGLNWIGRYRRTDRPLDVMTHGGSFMMARSET